MNPLLEQRQVSTNGIRLNVAQAGPSNGRLVILLHGFPEFWYGWRRQIPYLADSGYRVWAPDQRGYNLSDKPRGIAAYNLDLLAADVIGLIDAAGQPKASLVAHDWGAAVGWWVAAKYPDRLERLAVLNCPNGSVMQRHLRRNPAQLRRSWYFLFFQVPWLPEALARRDNWRALVSTLRKTSRPGTFTNDDFDQYRQAWSQPQAYSSMLNWYRAIVRRPPQRTGSRRIAVPTLLIWGTQDEFLGRELAQPSVEMCEHGRLVFIEQATHWVQHEEPDKVNALLGEFLKENS